MKLTNRDGDVLILSAEDASLFRMMGKPAISSTHPFPADASRFGEVITAQHMTNPPTLLGYELWLAEGVTVSE